MSTFEEKSREYVESRAAYELAKERYDDACRKLLQAQCRFPFVAGRQCTRGDGHEGAHA